MKENTMRKPLLISGGVLLVFVLLAYLTNTSSEGSVLDAAGQLIIGVFRLVQWAIALAIGLTVCIAFLIGIFLFAVSLVNKTAAVSMYGAVKEAVRTLCRSVCSCCNAFGQGKEAAPCTAPLEQAVVPDSHFKEELQAALASAVRKITEGQQVLSDQCAALASKIQALEEKSADFAAAGQLQAMASELAVSGKTLATVQVQVAALESMINETVQQLQGITPEKMLGDIPARLQKLEQPKDEPPQDKQPAPGPAPPVASMENVQAEQAQEPKKRKSSSAATKTGTKKKT